jgi:heterotetrameric sarcosine oxidase gamma subunit
MAELVATTPLTGHLRPGRHGRPDGPPGLVLRELQGWQIAGLAARRGGVPALAAALRQGWGLELPLTPRRTGDARLALLWAGLDHWLAVAPDWPGRLQADLAAGLGDQAAVTAQGDGRVLLRLSGPAAREALARLVPIDLHPRAFAPGDTAITVAAHIGLQIWQEDDTPAYTLCAFRGFAASLAEAVLAAGAAFGVEVAG